MLSKLTKPGVIDVFVDGSIANETINGCTPKPEKCLIYRRNVGWQGNYDDTKNPMPQSEFMKFVGTVTSIINGPGFTSDQIDDHVLQVLAALMQNIEDGTRHIVAVTDQSCRYALKAASRSTAEDAQGFRKRSRYHCGRFR